MMICRKYRLIPQEYNKNINNMVCSGGYLWIWGVWFCGVCGGVRGCRQANNRLKINRLF